MKTVIVASTNPVKIDAARSAFTAMFPDEVFEFQGVQAESGVADQPVGNDETEQGAINRVMNAKRAVPDADYYAANESGVIVKEKSILVINWVAVSNGTFIQSTMGTSYPPPATVCQLLRQGKELDPAFRQVFGEDAAKQGAGGVGKLTHGNVPRVDLVRQAMMTALIPFKNPELYNIDCHPTK